MSATLHMPHAGHCIVGNKCQFHLNTYVNGFIVSTIGEYAPHFVYENGKSRTRNDNDTGFETLGANRLYETMVFIAEKSDSKCCPFRQASGENVDFAGYNTDEAAAEGHRAMVEKYRKGEGAVHPDWTSP